MRRAKMTGMKRGIHLSPFGDEAMTPTPTKGVVEGDEVGMGIGGGGGGGGGGRGTTKIASIQWRRTVQWCYVSYSF